MAVVTVSKFAEKQLNKIPKNIAEALRYWVEAVEGEGVLEIRKLKGYHDESLKGNRKGQRSIRLSKAYRVIYVETNKNLEILVIEVNKHEY